MHETLHRPAASSARKGSELDPDAPNRLPSPQLDIAQSQRPGRNQAKQHLRENTLREVLSRVDTVKNPPPTSGAADCADISKSTLGSGNSRARRADRGEPSGGRPLRATAETTHTADVAVQGAAVLGCRSPLSPGAIKHVAAHAAPCADTGTGAALLTTTAGSHTGSCNAIARNLDEAQRPAQLTVKRRDMGDKARSRDHEKDGSMQGGYAQVGFYLFSVNTGSLP